MINIFYDSLCKPCNKVVLFLNKKVSVSVSFHPVIYGYNKNLTKFGISSEEVLDAMILVDESGSKFHGYYAFKVFYTRYSRDSFLKFVFKLRLSDHIGPKIYSLFALNRHKFGCTSDTCQVKGHGI